MLTLLEKRPQRNFPTGRPSRFLRLGFGRATSLGLIIFTFFHPSIILAADSITKSKGGGESRGVVVLVEGKGRELAVWWAARRHDSIYKLALVHKNQVPVVFMRHDRCPVNF